MAILANQIASDAVTTVKILDANITAAKLGALAVTEAKIDSLAVTEGKIGAGAVTVDKIGALAVTTAKIAALAVTAAEIGALAVTEAKINTGAVTADKLGALAVTTAKIDALAVTTAKIAALAVTTAEIGALAVTTAKIDDLGVTTGKLAANAVTAAKADLTTPWSFLAANLQITDTPSAANDAVNKTYVDAAMQGASFKEQVRAATTANITSLSGAQTVDGISLVAGDRILVKNQTTTSQNGLYLVAAGAWTRTTDADAGTELDGTVVWVDEGTTNGDQLWAITTPAPVTIGTTGTAWAQISGLGQVDAGAGLTKSGNTIDVVIAAGSGGLTANANDVTVNYGTTEIANVDAAAESAGTSELLARADHKHTVNSGTPGAIAPADTADAGAASTLALSDHRHSIAVAAPGTAGVAATSGEGNATSFARSNHTHQSNTAAAVTSEATTASTVGTSGEPARADHEHQFPDLGREGLAQATGALLQNMQRRDAEMGYDAIDAEGIVQGTSTEFQVASSTGSDVQVSAANNSTAMAAYSAGGGNGTTGNANKGARVPGTGSVQTASLTAGTFTAGQTRLDVVSLKPNGGSQITIGNLAAPGTENALPAGAVKLATVSVPSSAGAIDAAACTYYDARRRMGRTTEEDFYAVADTAQTFVLGVNSAAGTARRIQTSKAKGVAVYRNGVKLRYLASPTTVDQYNVTNVAAANGSTVSLGLAKATADEITMSYWY